MLSSPHNLRRGKRFNLSSLSALIDYCLSLNSLLSAQSIHANLIKTGFHRHIFLGNRLTELYSRSGDVSSSFKAFSDVPTKNTFSWNILLAAFAKSGRVEDARNIFDEMPQRDIVSWNTMVSGYISNGYVDEALGILYRMQELGVRASGFTLSIVASYVSSAHHGKQVHGLVLRNGLYCSNTVVSNSLIGMYRRVGLVEYACYVFWGMEDQDVISWNSMLSVYKDAGHSKQAFECFRLMRDCVFAIDEFTVSTILNVCADLEDLAKGEQLLALCFKMGFLWNSIVSSAIIDMYSICDRLADAVQLFEEMMRWDSAICNSMISCFARNGLIDEALRIFVDALRMDVRPTEMTFASILSSSSYSGLTEQGTQIHSWISKSGFDADEIVSSALINMYAKLGLTQCAIQIFSTIAAKDLISWNTMIMGLAQNGQGKEALGIFKEMQDYGIQPDRITLLGVLTACSYEGMIHEGKRIFSLMEKKYGVVCGLEHYACMVDMMGRAGRFREAIDFIENMPHKPTASPFEMLLEACRIHGNLHFAELVAEKVMNLEPLCSLPYIVLARMYGSRGKWESMARVWKSMKERGVKKVQGCSWLSIRNCIYVFKSDQILHYGGEDTYTILALLVWEMESEGYAPEHIELEYGDEE
ncbi:pentatricopeptide repeat-containing protein At1g43980, mitochondrial [Typha latifolia]|uniref:pentatricopeptide repeat-containing protein At1g43980, mitochondrial n=1 Tax=Typha latifolia TaxID=4733 RepID=UPI003C2C9F8C